MSLLFNRPAPAHCTFIVRPEQRANGTQRAQASALGHVDEETVFLGSKLWTKFASNDITRACISIGPIRPYPTNPSLLSSVSCWAILDQTINEDALAIHPAWLMTYSHIFPRDALENPANREFLSVLSVRPVPLTEVIVTALSQESYLAASRRDSVLESWFSDARPILRYGDVHSFGITVNDLPLATLEPVQYRLTMLQPVLQGYAEKNTTKLIVTLLEPMNQQPSEFVKPTCGDSDGIEIDESFLANSFLKPSFIASLKGLDGRSPQDIHNIGLKSERHSFKPVSSATGLLEDNCTVYLRTADLARIGILNGDWAVASADPSRLRLVRVIANDILVTSIGQMSISPVLLHNMYPDSDAIFRPLTTIHLLPSPFGSYQPPIPTARTLIVARVASPLSINRAYQDLFLSSLKGYFEVTRRLIKRGDVIGVPIDTDLSRSARQIDSGDHQIETDHYYPGTVLRPNEVVYFVVTNVEYDVLGKDLSSQPEDMYLGSTLGELGCWVDTAATRVVQTGLEHMRIPDIGGYLDWDQANPRAIFSALVKQSSYLLRPSAPFGKIFSLSSAALARSAIDYDLQLSLLLKGARGIGKFTTAFWVAQRLGMHLFEIDCYDILGESKAETEGFLRTRFDQAQACTPCIVVLRHLEALSQTTQALEPNKEPTVLTILREGIDGVRKSWGATGYPAIVLGTTCEPASVPLGILACFKHEINFEAPNERERLEILSSLLQNSFLAPDVSLVNLATQTAALVAADLTDLVTRAKSRSIERIMKAIDCDEDHLDMAEIPLTAGDFEIALGKARESYSESIGAPKIPNVSWNDVGGLAHVKSDILDTIQLPLDHPELFSDGIKKRSGILLYGPPGTGKTLIAKAVATSCSLNFFSVKGPELLNMYIGESEANVRRVFQRARDAKPCVIFFDELDSVAPKRGNQGDSGGVMDRIVSQLLAELDGMSGGKAGADVFVIGATNRPDLLDPALLRPGRFDRLLYLGVSESHQAQVNILEALTRNFRLDRDVDLCRVAEQCPFNYTGADFYALCSDAMLNAMLRKADFLESKIADMNKVPESLGQHPYPMTPQYFLSELASPDDLLVAVSQVDFDNALVALVPSVTQAEMEHYARVQHHFSQGANI